eukprot:gene6364-6157_t
MTATVHMMCVMALLSGYGGASEEGVCDILTAAGTPCVAAYSVVRRLSNGYGMALYQVTRTTDNATLDVNTTADGYANTAPLDGFCASAPCVVSQLFDQSPRGNHLTPGPGGGHAHGPDRPVNATRDRHMVGGHAVYSMYFGGGMGYRRDETSGVAKGDGAETIVMVGAGDHTNVECCFDFGNAETNNSVETLPLKHALPCLPATGPSTNRDDGRGTMEAVYLGRNHGRGARQGDGLWPMGDVEDGSCRGATEAAERPSAVDNHDVTAMLKGRSGGTFALKAGDAGGGGELATRYDGPRPAGYEVMKKQGAIILGIGGDNSNAGVGTFFEGVITAGCAPSTVDEAVHANIAAAGPTVAQARDCGTTLGVECHHHSCMTA